MSARARRFAFVVLAAIAVGLFFVCAVLEVYGALIHEVIEIPHTVYLVAMVLGFVGFFGLNPQEAKDGADVIVGSAVKIIGALPRFGRRASDAIAVPGTKTETVAVPVSLPRDDAAGIEPTP